VSAVTAAVVDQRIPTGGSGAEYFTDEDRVVAAGVHFVDAAFDPGEGLVQNGSTIRRGMPRNIAEFFLGVLPGEAAGERLAILPQHIDREETGVVNAVVGIGATIDAGEDQRRLEGEGCHRVGREPARLAGRGAGRDDGDTCDPVAEHPAEFGGIDGHARAVSSELGPVPRAREPDADCERRGVVGCFLPSADFSFAGHVNGEQELRSKEAVIKRTPLAGCLILTFLAACDNVSWGGADVTIVPPPPKASGAPEPGVEPGAERLPDGPVLYHVVLTEGGGRITPIAEITGDSLAALRPIRDPRAWGEAFIEKRLQPGSEFVLFHQGVRVGTLIAQSAAIDASGCRPMPSGTGALELGQNASGVREFLALARTDAPQIQRRNEQPLTPTRTMRVLAPILADRMLRSRKSPLPGNWEKALVQLQPFPVPGSPDLAFTATFLVGDTLGPGLDDNGQALFFVALPASMGYDTAFVDFRNYATTQKAAPAVVDFLDWNSDDIPDLLLRVHGVNDAWYEAVGRRNGRWRILFSDRCERPAAEPPSPDTTGAAPPSLPVATAPPDTSRA
jgi:hypothetical protein